MTWYLNREMLAMFSSVIRKAVSGGLMAGVLGVGLSAAAQDGGIFPEYDKRMAPEMELRAFGPDLLGDGIDPHTGSISFSQTDVVIPGNSGLEVAIRRRRSSGFFYSHNTEAEFGDWLLSVPRIHAGSGSQSWNGNRCTDSFDVSLPTYTGSIVLDGGDLIGQASLPNFLYSDGVMMETPDGGSQQVLENKQGGQWPASASHVTADGWYLECISNIGAANGGGQGFYAYAPNGNRYTFDRFYTHARNSAIGDAASVQRGQSILAATEVTDVNGNWVRYTYDTNKRLTRIHANDGREITLVYQGSSQLISEVRAHGRVWQYSYGPSTFEQIFDIGPVGLVHASVLRTVTRPDGTQWSFDIDGMTATPGPGSGCIQGGQEPLIIRHPSGVTGEFVLRERRHRQTFNFHHIQRLYCPRADVLGGTNVFIPATYETMAVVSKKLSGPGMETAEWTYEYEQDTESQPGSSSNDRTNWTKVQHPTGVHETFYHTWNDEPLGGKMVRREIREGGPNGAMLERTVNTYVLEDRVGQTFAHGGPTPESFERPARMLESRTERGTDIYTTSMTYNSDMASTSYSFGSPIQSVASSTLQAEARDTVTTYEHNKAKWILGLPKQTIRNGKLFEDFVYDSLGRMVEHSQFGVRDATFTYHTSGVQAGRMHTFQDALNRQMTMNDWYRGRPRQVTRADGVVLTRGVDDHGQLTSESDAKGSLYAYDYDAGGRLALINPPGNLASTTITYNGLGTGNLTQTATTGTQRAITKYDALYRPYQSEQRALSGGGGSIFMTTQYDALNRPVFTSFPQTALAATTTGVETTYDALGRTTQTRENVAPFATVQTAYLSGNRTRVTDAEDYVTTTTSSGYGSYDDGSPVLIQQPEGVTTTSTYDIYGNLLSASQGAFTQVWQYDDRLRLCAQTTPETGTTKYQYDNANQVISYAEGQGPGCGAPPSASQIVNTYDVLGRIEHVNYPDSTPDTAMIYDLNGNLTRNTRGSSVWDYAYDATDQLISETLSIDGRTYATSYAYNGNGALTHQTTPAGRTVETAPDGFGRPTRASVGSINYASGGQYHPNGALASLVYGNQAQLSTSLNPRQQTQTSRTYRPGGPDVLDYIYTYDANSRIIHIDDRVEEAGAGLVALGAIDYTYDALNNLRSKQLGADTVSLQYDSRNRLASFSDTREGGGLQAQSYDARGNIMDDGTLAFTYDAANQPISLSDTASEPHIDVTAYTNKGAVMAVGQVLYEGERLVSSNGQYSAVFQSNGALSVVHNGEPLWSSTAGNGSDIHTLNLQGDCNLVAYRHGPFAAIWNTETPGCGETVSLHMQDDGNLVLYQHAASWVALSASNTAGQTGRPPAPEGSFVYDGHYKRVKQTINGETIYSVYSLSGAILYRDNATTGVTTDYIRLGTKTIARIKGADEVSYLHQDHLGSPVAATGPAGNVLWREAFTPFGETLENPLANKDNESFTGHIKDTATGLTYMQARYYNPVIGRFLSNDPVGFAEGGPAYFNRYAYTANDPVNLIDPTGLCGTNIAGRSSAATTCGSSGGGGGLQSPKLIDPGNTPRLDGSLGGGDTRMERQLAAAVDQIERDRPAREAQSRAMREASNQFFARLGLIFATIASFGAGSSATPLFANAGRGSLIAGGADGGGQLFKTGEIDAAQTLRAQGAGALGGALTGSTFRSGANFAKAQGSNKLGQLAAGGTFVSTFTLIPGGLIAGGLSVSNGGSFGEGFGIGVVNSAAGGPRSAAIGAIPR